MPARATPRPATGAPAATVPGATAKATGTADVETKPEFADQVEARTQQLFLKATQRERSKPPAKRATPDALWKQAHSTAKTEIRRKIATDKIKHTSRTARDAVLADLTSAVHRNRHQLAPWLLAAPYAALGEGAHLLATHGPGVPIGISALCATTSAGASLVAWHTRIAGRTPARFTPKVQAGMGLLCGWTGAMPLVPPSGQAGMWLALLAGTAWMGLSWWREHDHPIPLPPDVLALMQQEAEQAADTTDEDDPFARRIISDWDTYVAGQGTLTGSTLSTPREIDYGWTFLLHLVRGKQRLQDVRNAKAAIADALDIDHDMLAVDAGPNHATVVLTIKTEEITNVYDGPIVVVHNGDVYIELGPYEDGEGAARFHVLSDQLTPDQLAAGETPRGSMNGGFVLGTKGSGKSRLMEAVAVGLRKLGVEQWYLDPQMGKSSPALLAEADWPLSGVHGAERAFGNLVDLWKAVKAVTELRSAEGAVAGHAGFQHTRQRPAIMVEIDECHGAFQAENPETGNSFGEDFADLDREMRKNGIGLFGASQAITQDTFGRGNKAAVLRDGMCAINVFIMSYGGKNLGLVPGYDGQPAGMLPKNRGYGYSPMGERPHVRWQTRYTPDFQSWLANYPKATLDPRAQKRIGQTYLDRFTKLDSDTAAIRDWLDTLDSHTGDASELPGPGRTPNENTAANGNRAGGTVTTLLSPRQQRLRAAGVETAPTHTTADQDADPHEQAASRENTAAELTETERRVLDILRATPQSPTTLASHLRISPQAAGKHLRNLAGKRAAVKMEDGRYMAR